jgi:hypothetical protein
MAVTIPIPYLFLFFSGLPALMRDGWKAPGRFVSLLFHDYSLLLAAFLVPLLVILALRPTLYDGWRHMYFLYAPFLLIAVNGADTWYLRLVRWQPSRRLILVEVALAVMLAPALVWMIHSHPYQSLYFNRLAGPDMRAAQQRFALDYWGLAYRQGLDYILKHDAAARIPVLVETEPGRRNAAIFPTSEEKRLDFVSDISQASYFVSNYNREPQGYGFENEIYRVAVGSAPILSVYQLTEEDKR